MSTTRGDHDPGAVADLHEATGDAKTILLLSKSQSPTVQTLPPDATNLILVSLGKTRAADRQVDESSVLDTFEHVQVIRPVPTTPQSVAASDTISVRSIEHPPNIADLGRSLADALSSDPAAAQSTVVSFHSLTTLLAHLDIHRVVYFIHVATGRIKTLDAKGHFYLDPAAHHPRTIRTLSPLFDRRLRSLPDNRWAPAAPQADETEYL